MTKSLIADGVKELLRKMKPEQDQKQIQDFQIHFPEGGWLRCDPDDQGGNITVILPNGKTVWVRAAASREEIEAQHGPTGGNVR